MEEAPRLTLTERRAQELRLHLAQTAAALFVAEGSTSVTVERIADAAGVHVRTFHRHFPVKEDVLQPLFAQTTRQLVDGLRAAPPDDDLVETVLTVWGPVLQGGLDDAGRTFMRLLVNDREYRFRWLQMDDALVEALDEFLRRRPGARTDDDLRTLPAALLVQTVRHVFEQWVRAGGEADLVDLLRRGLRMVTDGLEPRGVGRVLQV